MRSKPFNDPEIVVRSVFW